MVFPFNKFPDADAILGPEMKSNWREYGTGRELFRGIVKALISREFARKWMVFFPQIRIKNVSRLLKCWLK